MQPCAQYGQPELQPEVLIVSFALDQSSVPVVELVVGTVHACSTYAAHSCMRMQDLQSVHSIQVQHNLITSMHVVMHANVAFGVAGPGRGCGYL